MSCEGTKATHREEDEEAEEKEMTALERRSHTACKKAAPA